MHDFHIINLINNYWDNSPVRFSGRDGDLHFAAIITDIALSQATNLIHSGNANNYANILKKVQTSKLTGIYVKVVNRKRMQIKWLKGQCIQKCETKVVKNILDARSQNSSW